MQKNFKIKRIKIVSSQAFSHLVTKFGSIANISKTNLIESLKLKFLICSKGYMELKASFQTWTAKAIENLWPFVLSIAGVKNCKKWIVELKSLEIKFQSQQHWQE